MKSRTLSDIKPIKPKKCEFDSIDCTPACKYYKTCIHSLHKQAVSLHIYKGKIMKKDSVKKETWKDWEQTCEKLKKYETTLKRVVLTTDKKLLYQAEYNRKIRAAQRQQ